MNPRHPGVTPQPDGWGPRLSPWICRPAEDEIFRGLGELCPRNPSGGDESPPSTTTF